MDATQDVVMTDEGPETNAAAPNLPSLLETPHSDAFAFNDLEERVLELYDHLRDLELQKSLAQAHESAHVPDTSTLSDDEVQKQLMTAQQDAMDAKAQFEIRNRISHNALVMDPVLKAVHGGEDTDVVEKRMLPIIRESDTLSMVHGSLSSKLATTTKALSEAEQSNMKANQKNRDLSYVYLEEAKELRAQATKNITNAELRRQMEMTQKHLTYARDRLRTIKEVLSAMIAGSGVNWAEDEKLRDLVMDEDEGD